MKTQIWVVCNINPNLTIKKAVSNVYKHEINLEKVILAKQFLAKMIEDIVIKGQTKSKRFFQANVSSKKRTKEFYFTTMKPQVNLFSFIFWRKLKTPKRHFKINWPLEFALLCNDQLTCPKYNKQQQNLPVCCILTIDVSFCHLLQQTLELPTFFKPLWFKPFCRLQSLRRTIPCTPKSGSIRYKHS